MFDHTRKSIPIELYMGLICTDSCCYGYNDKSELGSQL